MMASTCQAAHWYKHDMVEANKQDLGVGFTAVCHVQEEQVTVGKAATGRQSALLCLGRR